MATIRVALALAFWAFSPAWSSADAFQCEDRLVVANGLNPCDRFGAGIACHDNVIVIGAPGSDIVANRGGAAYVFEYTAGRWVETQTLISSDPGPLQEFGLGLAFDGETLMINGERDSTGVAGAVFVFERIGGGWVETQMLSGGSPGGGLGFGREIVFEGDSAFIVSPGSAVHEFQRAGGTWQETAVVTEQNIAPYVIPGQTASFANRIAVVGDTMAIGHRGVAPVHVLRKTAGVWQAAVELTVGGGFDGFVDAPVAMSSSRLLVGGELVDFQRGVVWAFEETSPGVWTHVQTLEASDGVAFSRFGGTVLIEENRAFIAAYSDDEVEMNAGAVYQFEIDGGTWIEKTKITPAVPIARSLFGAELEVNVSGLVVGAPGFIANLLTGTAHDVPLPIQMGHSFCAVNRNSSGAGLLAARGQPVIDYNCLCFTADGLPPGQFGYMLMGLGQAFVPLFGASQGNLCISLPLVRFSADILLSDAGGSMAFTPDLNALPQSTVFQPGDTWNFQMWFRDMNPGQTSNTTNGLALTFETTGEPAVQFPSTLLSVEEANTQFDVVITLSQTANEGVSIPYSTGGTATYNVDWRVEETNPIVISAGETSVDMTIVIAEDGSLEGDETGIITLGTPTGGILGTAPEFTLTIVDDD